MSMSIRDKKCSQLGMDAGTAAHKLRKQILFSLLQEAKRDKCFRCQAIIETARELSVEHKVPWLDSDNPVQLFFDLSNIAFSHLSCNAGDARPVGKKYFTPESRQEADREIWRRSQKKTYTSTKRRDKYLRKGY